MLLIASVTVFLSALLITAGVVHSATAIAKALNDGGRSLSEAMGGFWHGVNEDPTFIPLDEVIAKHLLEEAESDFSMTDLVLETDV